MKQPANKTTSWWWIMKGKWQVGETSRWQNRLWRNDKLIKQQVDEMVCWPNYKIIDEMQDYQGAN